MEFERNVDEKIDHGTVVEKSDQAIVVEEFDIYRASIHGIYNGIKGRILRLEVSKLKPRIDKREVQLLARQIQEFIRTKTAFIRDRLSPGRQQLISLDDRNIYLWNISSPILLSRFVCFLWENNIQICSVFLQRCGEKELVFKDEFADLAFGLEYPKKSLAEFQQKISSGELADLHIPSNAEQHTHRWIISPPSSTKIVEIHRVL